MTNFDKTLNDQLWSILTTNNDPFDVVLATNRINLYPTDEDEGVDELKTTWNDGDFPEVVIFVQSAIDAFYTLSPSYARRLGVVFDPAAQSVITELRQEAIIEVTFTNANFTKASKFVDEALMIPLRKSGPHLGITGYQVQSAGPITRQIVLATNRGGQQFANPDGMRRAIAAIKIPVVSRLQMKDLLA